MQRSTLSSWQLSVYFVLYFGHSVCHYASLWFFLTWNFILAFVIILPQIAHWDSTWWRCSCTSTWRKRALALVTGGKINSFLNHVIIWFLLDPQYFTCSTNIKFILEHLFINLSVLKIYYFCPILKKSKWSCANYGNPKWRQFTIYTCRNPTLLWTTYLPHIQTAQG